MECALEGERAGSAHRAKTLGKQRDAGFGRCVAPCEGVGLEERQIAIQLQGWVQVALTPECRWTSCMR